VIDMQRAWTRPEGPMHTPTTRDIVPAINRLAAALRARGGRVVWVQHSNAPPGSPLYWSTYYDNFIAPARRAASLATLAPGSALHALEPSLDACEEDERLLKYRFSAFTRNPADPEAKLRAAGIDTVIVAGVATNICCESTARDAMMRDFKVFMPHDAVTASTPDQHFAGLGSVMQVFADIRPTGALLALLDSG
jgi:ureidoacrylate peracid hydrolase